MYLVVECSTTSAPSAIGCCSAGDANVLSTNTFTPDVDASCAIAEISAIAAPLTIGLAFAVQEVARVPADWHDRALDLIVTEDGVITRAGDA